MQEIIAGQRSLPVNTVIKLRAGREAAAKDAAKKNGADDLFFELGGDAYVASGRSLDLRGLTPGAPVEWDGRHGKVVAVDDAANSFGEGFGRAAKGGLLATAGVAAGGGALWAIARSCLSSASLAGPVLVAFVGYGAILATCAVGGISMAVAAATGKDAAATKPDFEMLSAFGEAR